MSPRLEAPLTLVSIPGFRAMGVHAGLKRKGRPDVALIVSDRPDTTCAAVFTQNAFSAAPVHVSRQHVADGDIRAIVVNSANANACTGRQGLRDALAMAETTAELLGIRNDQVLVCSTGRIGLPMPMEKVLAGIRDCAGRLDEGIGSEAAHAILTTDCGPKETHTTFQVDGKTCTLAGIAKGAGMIHPNMATMLAFLVTDANVPAPQLKSALRHAVNRSFNQISVDGDESTNDTAAILANNASDTAPLTPEHPDWAGFQDAVTTVCQDLAKRIAADGEGATKLLQVDVEGATDDAQARAAARAVASSNLVKCAIHGEDPNWGRIVSAVGQSGVAVDPTTVDLRIGDMRDTVELLRGGEVMEDPEEGARALLAAPEVRIRMHLHQGTGTGSAWGCDLTNDYVTFNSAYTT